MKHFKDFLYDKNDILIALLILVAAALIILWRMDIIMAYPQTIFSENGGAGLLAQNGGDGQQGSSDNGEGKSGENGDSQSGQSGENEGNGNGQSDGNGDSQSDGNGESGNGQGTSGSSLFANDRLTRDVEVNVTGNTASAAIECLVDAGLFKDYAEYQQICADTGLDHEKVSAGILTFAKGSTKKDIARKINWS